MNLVLSLLLLFLLGLSTASEYSRTVSYDGELVIRCGMQNERMRELLNHDMVDVWTVTTDSADIRLHYDLYEQLRDKFPECVVLHASVEKLVQEFEQNMQKRSNVTAEWFEEYHRYEDIVKWYKDLAEDSKGLVTYIESFGKSFEGRDQPAVHIGAKDANMKIYFQCQIHAREWISGATCMYIAKYLAENYNKDERVTNLLNELVFIFVPFVNPDGYEYTWTNSRLWRKNRQNPPSGSTCYGVDLNRNYNDHWNGGGSSSNPCSDTYHGTSAASEPETKNMANYFKSSGNIIGAIDWHSYSQLILRPYGWTENDCPDEKQLGELGAKMKTEIEKVHGKKYTSQKSIDLYITTGTASDWFYSDDANDENEYMAAGFTIELRDTGLYGFELPPDQIIPTGEEMIPAVLTFAEELKNNPLKK